MCKFRFEFNFWPVLPINIKQPNKGHQYVCGLIESIFVSAIYQLTKESLSEIRETEKVKHN